MDRADFQALARDLPEARKELNCLAQLMGNQSNLQREIRGQSAEVRSRQTWGVWPLFVRLLSAEYLGQSIDFSALPAGSAATGSWLSASRSTQSAVFRQVMSAGVHHNPFQELLHYSAFQTLRFTVCIG